MFKISLQAPSPAPIRAIHGVNLGPIDRYWACDYSEFYRRVRIPSVRTHDCRFSAADVVDLHYIFRDPNADPDDPANYDFLLTDDYLAKIHEAGCKIYYRLGESIEGRNPRKRFVNGGTWKPETLAKVCLNIARHYNEGWNNGFTWNVADWQFWNEPQNSWILPPHRRPCWTGTTAEFYQLYGAVARAFKAHRPEWKIGLAGYGRPDFIFPEGHPLFHKDCPWRHIEDVVNAGPIDSISWHQYGASWEDLVRSANMLRDKLDAHGLGHAESHITEWNYNPRLEDEKGAFTWFNVRSGSEPERLARVEGVMTGVQGAAYVFGALARLQPEPVDMTHLYTGISSAGGALGLFSRYGHPHPKAEGMELFARFLDSQRLPVEGGEADRVTALAARDAAGGIRVGIAHLNATASEVEVFLDEETAAPTECRQFLEAGWGEIAPGVRKEGGGTVLTLPLGGHGLTEIVLPPQA